MIIRSTRKADIPEVYELIVRSFDKAEVPPYEVFVGMAAVGDMWVAVEDDVIIGVILVNPRGGIDAYVHIVAVDLRFRHRGVAGNLLRQVSLYYADKKYKFASLHVHIDNPAQTLYYDNGFRVYEVIKNHYPDYANTRGLLMRKML